MERMDWRRVSTIEAVRSLPQDRDSDRSDKLRYRAPWLRIWAASTSLGDFLGGRVIRFEMASAESKAAKGQKP
jgi:hypothetical protein